MGGRAGGCLRGQLCGRAWPGTSKLGHWWKLHPFGHRDDSLKTANLFYAAKPHQNEDCNAGMDTRAPRTWAEASLAAHAARDETPRRRSTPRR